MPLRLRTTSVRRNGKVYRYHQLTRAIRKNGRPTHEIVAHLGRLDDEEAEWIKGALDVLTGRKRKPKGRTADTCLALDDVVAHKALRFLDVMVVHRLWRQWGLGAFFNEHVPKGDLIVAPADVIEILVANRCLAPCSKLRVTEWTPRTVLPQLLRLQNQELNNTRIHRVLNQLDGIEPRLTEFLVRHPLRTSSIDTVVYLDITDTWFVGAGSELAEGSRCKDGNSRPHRIQIALGVDARGLPLRWEVFPGKASEQKQLPSWIDAIGKFSDFDDVPLVFDRGFSTNENLRSLVKEKRRFITCAKIPHVSDWAPTIDFAAIGRHVDADGRPLPENLEAMGLTKAEDDADLFFLDHGVREPYTTRGRLPEMRVMLFFRPGQYLFERRRATDRRRKLQAALDALNADLRQAKVHRDKKKTLTKITRELRRRKFEYAYVPTLKSIKVRREGRKPVRSFQIELTPKDSDVPAKREYDIGWRVLLASAEDDRPARELIRQYDQKAAVEYAFRTIKSFVLLRPIRHQTAAKIKTHVTLCILALLLDRWLEICLRKAKVRDSVDRVYEILEPCRLLSLADRNSDNHRLIPVELDDHQQKILQAVGMSNFSPETAAQQLSTCRH